MGTQKVIPGLRHYVAVDGGMADNIRPALYGAAYTPLAATRSIPPSTVIGLALAFAPQWMVWVLVAFTIVNGAFLLASIAATARTSLGHR